VTVDWLDETGHFAGGAIFPGFRLMAQALHDHTALLPLIEVPGHVPALPGTSTTTALEAGVFWAVVGGIRALIDELAVRSAIPPQVFLTGGDAALVGPSLQHMAGPVTVWPHMTLEGIRLAAEALP
jgi:type III pantothenate kinase